MTRAILTITCPHCGGKVEGVNATNVDQTIDCVYCKTELHVPRVGERVIIREVALAAEPPVVLRKSVNPFFGIVMFALSITFLFGALRCTQAEETDYMADYEKKRAAEQACKDSCTTECVGAGDKEANVAYFDDEMKASMADTDRKMCAFDCERAHDCSGLNYLLKKQVPSRR